MNIIQAIKIKTGTAKNKTSVGLSNGNIFWSESAIAGTSDTWHTGFVRSIGAIKSNADFTRGGNVVQLNNVQFTIANTNQLSLRLQELDIALIGMVIEVHEFCGTDSDSDSVYHNIIFTGAISSIEWGQSDLVITAKSGLSDKRNKLLCTVLDDGKNTPVTFGQLDKVKLIQTVNEEVAYTSDTLLVGGLPTNQEIFPFLSKELADPLNVGISTYTHFTVQIANASTDNAAGFWFTPTDWYLKVVDGDNAGQLRKVLRWKKIGSPYADSATFEINAAFEGDTFNLFSVVTIDKRYVYDNTSNVYVAPSDGLKFYAYDSDTYTNISNVAFTRDASKCLYKVNPEFSGSNSDTVNTFLHLPFKSVSEIDLSMSELGNQWGNLSVDTKYSPDGTFYYYAPSGSSCALDAPGIADSVLLRHKFWDIYNEGGFYYVVNGVTDGSITGQLNVLKPLSLKMPDYPKNFNFNKVYLGFDSGCLLSVTSGEIQWVNVHMIVKQRPFYGTATLLSDKYVAANSYGTVMLRNIADEYYVPNESTSNVYFYNSLYNSTHCYGYNQIPIFSSNVSEKMYNYLYELGVLLRVDVGMQYEANFTVYHYIDALCVIFEGSSSIKDAIYTNLSGRTYGDTWGSRKTAADLISNPVDILEYAKRNSDWSESSNTPLINTTSFDDSSLSDVKALVVARQIIDKDDCYTSEISKSICNSFFLASYQDGAGYERVKKIIGQTSHSISITLADIIPDSISQVQEPDVSDIFVEPYIDYCYDVGSETYTKHLVVKGVTNLSITAWSTDLTPGFSGYDGQTIWNSCRNLYLKYMQKESFPEDMAKNPWIYDYDTALWRLTNIISWQGKKRISFDVPYLKCKGNYVGDCVGLSLPHETNGGVIKCLIEGITKHKEQNKCSLDLVFIDEVETLFFLNKVYQNVFNSVNLKQQDVYSSVNSKEQGAYDYV